MTDNFTLKESFPRDGILFMTFGHIPGMTNEMPAKESIPAIRPNHNSWKDPALGSSEWTNDATI